MLKKVLLSVAVILFVSAVALADIPTGAAAGSIYQYQNFVVGDLLHPSVSGISSILTVSHGDDAFSLQSLNVSNEQSVPWWFGSFGGPFMDPCPTLGNQWQCADLLVKTEAEADCGIITVSGFLSGMGIQDQFIGYSDDPKWQAQTLGLAADQLLLGSGNAEGTAINDVDDMSQGQAGINGAGSISEDSLMNAFQLASVEGKPNTTVSAVNSMLATTTQNQIVF